MGSKETNQYLKCLACRMGMHDACVDGAETETVIVVCDCAGGGHDLPTVMTRPWNFDNTNGDDDE